MSLIVTATPEKKLAYSNEVYCSPNDYYKFSNGLALHNYVKVGGMVVYTLRPHNNINDGEIALNMFQRKAVKGSNGAPIPVEIFTPPSDASKTLYSLRLEVSLARNTRALVDEEGLVGLVRLMYVDQPMCQDMGFLVDYQGTPLILTVKGLQVPNPAATGKGGTGTITKYAKVALLGGDTLVEIQPNKQQKLLEFEKHESADRGHTLFNPDWKFADMGIGGLDAEFSSIFRRAFASRLFPPATIEKLGIKHVKGMLLHGPPGTGKTLIARQIGKLLAGKEPKVVNGPDVLNKFVGQTEENIRKLFLEAEEEYAEKGEKSELHIIIFDEIDAICKKRGSTRGGTGVQDTLVNQLLTKIDGVNSPNNFLVIGMTNRKDMMDPALLRPGRLEVHVEIGLPDEPGREQIFKIHTRKMQESGLLADDVDLKELAYLSKNYSGAEIEGVVKAATSYALYGHIDVTAGDQVDAKTEDICVKMEHLLAAISEIEPNFGASEDEFSAIVRGDLIDYGAAFREIVKTGQMLVRQVQTANHGELISMLLQGPPGCGKTSIAAKIALGSEFPYMKLISPDNMIGYSEREKVEEISKCFEDAYKSPLSLIILDNIERLLEYVRVGPRFSNTVLQALMVLVKKLPPKSDGCKLLVVATSSDSSILEDLQLSQAFNIVLSVPEVTSPNQVKKVFHETKTPVQAAELEQIVAEIPFPIGIKQLLMVIEMASSSHQENIIDDGKGADGKGNGSVKKEVVRVQIPVTYDRFMECMRSCGLVSLY